MNRYDEPNPEHLNLTSLNLEITISYAVAIIVYLVNRIVFGRWSWEVLAFLMAGQAARHGYLFFFRRRRADLFVCLISAAGAVLCLLAWITLMRGILY